MRVFAKDVSGQKLDRGFESRPLRWLVNVETKMTGAEARIPGALNRESYVSVVTLLERR